jgi:hypothetical protein
MHKLKTFFYKLLHWEYWPFEVVNFPIVFVWLFYGIRSRSLFYFNATNPRIKNGGFLMESKKEIYDLIPPQYIPKTIFCKKGIRTEEILSLLAVHKIQYPFIAKPDIGMKGLAVAKINSEAALETYLQKVPIDFLIQEFIDYPNEVGIFYYRLPNAAKGYISGIVSKEFLTVTGDGVHTIKQLIEQSPRASLQLNALEKAYTNFLETILPNGELMNLVPFGNHSRGAKFIDAKEWITDKLTTTIDAICQQVPDFYYGRLDIKYNSIAQLEQGKAFAIIELNGAGSEPTHIYDPKHSIFFAWKEITRHHSLQFKISKYNHQKGFPYLSFKEGKQMFKDNAALVKKLEAF